MRLIIILLLLVPLVAFSQTTDTLSISVIVPKSVSPTVEIVKHPPIEPAEQMEMNFNYRKAYEMYYMAKPSPILSVGPFEMINSPKGFWFFLDLIAVRD